MHRIFFLLCFGLLSINLFGQIVAKTTTIRGKVLQHALFPDEKKVYISISPLATTPILLEAEIAEDGTFQASTELFLPLELSIAHRAYFRIILRPGDDIYLEFDSRKEDENAIMLGLKMEGSAAALNREFHQYLLDYASIAPAEGFEDSIAKTASSETYLQYEKEVDAKMQQHAERYIQQIKPSDIVADWIRGRKMSYFCNLVGYPIHYRKRMSLHASYYDDLAHLPKLTENMLVNLNASSNFPGFFYSWYILGEVNKQYEKDRTQNYDSLTIAITKQLIPDNELLIQLVFAKQMMGFLKRNELNKFDWFRKQLFGTLLKEPYLIEPLLVQYTELQQHNDNPTASKEVQVYEIPDTCTNLIDYIRQCHPNTVIFLDIWATWCGSCIESIPKHLEMQQMLSNTNSKVIFLCTNSSRKAFDATLSRKQWGGIHYILSPKQSNQLADFFNSIDILGHLLLSKKGRILCTKGEFGGDQNRLIQRMKALSTE